MAVRKSLELTAGLTAVDATVGAGGHSFDILESISPGGTLIGIDRDPMMLAHALARLQSSPHFSTSSVHLCQGSYVTLSEILADRSIQRVDRVLADLGLSSDQLADNSRGFRFQSDGLLDLRFDIDAGEPAHGILASRSTAELAGIFRDFGEERHSDAIAKQIVAIRRQTPVDTARKLSDVVESVVQRRGSPGIHPATRVFQALRIAANNELEHVRQFTEEILPETLRSDGRAAIITFHSLEDRIVKHAFRNKELWELLTRKPLEPTAAEKRHNPRSRSAKLRTALRK